MVSNVVCNMIGAALGAFSFTLLVPFLNALFNKSDLLPKDSGWITKVQAATVGLLLDPEDPLRIARGGHRGDRDRRRDQERFRVARRSERCVAAGVCHTRSSGSGVPTHAASATSLFPANQGRANHLEDSVRHRSDQSADHGARDAYRAERRDDHLDDRGAPRDERQIDASFVDRCSNPHADPATAAAKTAARIPYESK